MIKHFTSVLAALAFALLLPAGAMAASSEVVLASAQVNLNDKASLRRGASMFMNYCAGCHSLKFMRYSRMGEDLGMTEEQVQEYLNFTKAKYGETMQIAMDQGDAARWFGKTPPDLSLVARNKAGGADWTYTFLNSFYVDDKAASGWNNTVLPNASMPNVLWSLQGIQGKRAAGHDDGHDAHDAGHADPFADFYAVQAGRMSDTEFRMATRDLTNFLAYVGEPAAMKRAAIGPWVMFFLTILTLAFWFLKKEYWRDIH